MCECESYCTFSLTTRDKAESFLSLGFCYVGKCTLLIVTVFIFLKTQMLFSLHNCTTVLCLAINIGFKLKHFVVTLGGGNKSPRQPKPEGSQSGKQGTPSGNEGKTKKEGSTQQKKETKANIDGSQAKKDGSQAKKDGSQAKKDGSQVKKDGSQTKKDGSQATKEGQAGDGAQPSKAELKRQRREIQVCTHGKDKKHAQPRNRWMR